MSRVMEIESRLRAAFSPAELEVRDESAHHIGHAGYQEGGESHFHVRMRAPEFKGMGRIARHRAVRPGNVERAHDGERFLLERYAVAITPSLDLLAPRSLDPGASQLLLAGVSELSMSSCPAMCFKEGMFRCK